MIQKKPAISVILPVYNVERFLYKCLSSLVEQTFTDYEIIVVNDGSLDGSLAILRDFESRYNFFIVIDQKNQGMSRARNAGLAVAQGEYVCFIDSDDYVAPQFLEHLYRACEENQADIACCYYYYHYVQFDILQKYPFRCHGVFSREEAMKKLLCDMQIQSLVWNKLYKRTLFTEHNITFPSMCFEDMATAHKIFAHANRVVVLDEALYYYNKHNTSTLATINANKINDFIRAMAMVRLSLERANVYRDYKLSYFILTKKTGGCCCAYVMKMHLQKKNMKGCISNLRRLLHAVHHYSADDFSAASGMLPDVVMEPEQLEKDYSVR